MFVLFVLSLFPISQDISEATPYGLSYRANLCLFVLESAIQSSLSWRFRVLAFQNNQSGLALPCVYGHQKISLLSSRQLQGPSICWICFFSHCTVSAQTVDLPVTWNSFLITSRFFDGKALCFFSLSQQTQGFQGHIQSSYDSQQALGAHWYPWRSKSVPRVNWDLALTVDTVILSTSVITQIKLRVKNQNDLKDNAKVRNSQR